MRKLIGLQNKACLPVQHARRTYKSVVLSGIHAVSDNTSVAHLNLLDLADQQFRGVRLHYKKKNHLSA